VRAERGQDRVLLLDGGDTLHGSLGSLRSKGQDVADCFKLLKPDATTGHWEFTYGEARAKELIAGTWLFLPRLERARRRTGSVSFRPTVSSRRAA
jgi:2',3'-cyclic-nucleotide 2'-phosphodiesterase (5'-nucleotidase family)